MSKNKEIGPTDVAKFIDKATKVLREYKVRKPYYIKIHKVNEGKAIPISDVKNILFKNGEIVRKPKI